MFYNNSLTSLPSALTLASLMDAEYMFYDNSLTDLPTAVTLSNLRKGTGMFVYGNTINTTRYSQLLIDLNNLNSNNSFSFHGGSSKYNTAGQTAKNTLTASPRNLLISDAGLA